MILKLETLFKKSDALGAYGLRRWVVDERPLAPLERAVSLEPLEPLRPFCLTPTATIS
jgi:hypothetical protein